MFKIIKTDIKYIFEIVFLEKNKERNRMGISTNNFAETKQSLMEMLKNELPVLRAKAKVSQKNLAEKIGISRQTYSGLETGRKEMTWITFLALVAFFQNNEQTKSMLGQIDGFSEGMIKVMESPGHEL